MDARNAEPVEGNWRKHQPGTLDREKLKGVEQMIQRVYLADARPWIIGFSGGKDSTAVLQLIWNSLQKLPKEKLTKRIHVITSDTLVENPLMEGHSTEALRRMNERAQAQGFPLVAQHVYPKNDQTFWVNMIGRGYPAPYNKFRWCTDRMKIEPANSFIESEVNKYGEVVLVLGVRRSESATRRQVMELYRRDSNLLSRHSKLKNAWVFTPIEDWDLNDVWTYLLSFPNPWGGRNRDLVALYKNGSGECPLVVDKTTPSCGSSRFGCWTCTVVTRDRSMEAAIDHGDDWMQPMLDLRDWLSATADPEQKVKYRSHRRRSGRIDTWGDAKDRLIWGPYTMEVRQEILRKLLEAEKTVRSDGPDPNVRLIKEFELHEIRRLWRTEEGDWSDSMPRIYDEVSGAHVDWVQEEDGGASALELAVLADVAERHELPTDLLKELIDVERQYRGMRRRSRVYDRLEQALKKDWRTAEEVFEQLERRAQGEWTAKEAGLEQADAVS